MNPTDIVRSYMGMPDLTLSPEEMKHVFFMK